MKRDRGWLGACAVTPRELDFDCDCDWIADPCAQDCGCGVAVMVSDVVESVLGGAGAPSRTHALAETLDMSQSAGTRAHACGKCFARSHIQTEAYSLNTGLSTQLIQSIICIQIFDSPRREVSGRLVL